MNSFLLATQGEVSYPVMKRKKTGLHLINIFEKMFYLMTLTDIEISVNYRSLWTGNFHLYMHHYKICEHNFSESINKNLVRCRITQSWS